MSYESFALAAIMELLAELKAAKLRIAELEAQLAKGSTGVFDAGRASNVVVLDKADEAK